MSGQTSPPASLSSSPLWDALPSDAPDTSLWSALRYGTHNALAGFGNTLRVAGEPGWGDAVANAVDAPVNYQPASDNVAIGMKKGDWDAALASLPRAILEQAPDLLGGVGAGMAGSALAGPVGGLAGAAAYYGGRDYGNDATAIATQRGHDTPTSDDLVTAAGDTALTSGLKAVGIRGGGAALGAVARGAAGAAKAGWGLAGEMGSILDEPATQEAGAAYELAQAAQDEHDKDPESETPMAKAGRVAKAYLRQLQMGLRTAPPKAGR